jgi:UDP-glucuronate 4-epimerase
MRGLRHLVYASSSSVYGGNVRLPFRTTDRVDSPISLYAATKKSAELMSHCYSHLYGIPQTGLRFFTAYGPWGRPDMAAYIFAKAIAEGAPLHLFNNGDMRRDFTYIDDVVAGTLAALDNPPAEAAEVPHRVFNIGNNRTEPLLRLVELLEDALEAKAERILEPMPPGDVKETYADISEATAELGYAPRITIDEGVPRFVAWFRDYHGV